MKKLCLLVLSLYCVGSNNIIMAGVGSNLIGLNKSFVEAVKNSIYGYNLATSFVALFTHNIIYKRSTNLFDLRDQQIVVSLTCGWLGDALSKLSFIEKKLPPLVQMPFKYPFATSWLAYNLIMNRDTIMQDPANLAVGAYLTLNVINDCNQ